jgi:hypothetical protein
MISIKHNYFKIVVSLIFCYLIVYSSFYLFKANKTYQENMAEKNLLELKLQSIKQKNKETIAKITQTIEEIAKTEKSYDAQNIVESKLKKIFARLSFQYKISLFSLHKLAINHYIIVAKVDSNNQQVINDFVQVLSQLGSIKQSEKNRSILYIDYIMEKNNEKK